MAKPQAGLGAILLLTMLPMCAASQDDITGLSIETHATFDNVGITVFISGDNNGDARASLEVSVDGAQFEQAHSLSRAYDDRFVGTAFWIGGDTDYEIRVSLEDPDGVSNGELVAAGTTRAQVVPEGTGDEIHVDPLGDDSNPGTEDEPLRTISAGLEAAGPEDTVTVHPGTYYEEVSLYSGGEDGAPVVLRASPPGEAIMSGANEDLLSPEMWTDTGGGIYSAPVDTTRYVAVDDVRLWRYESLYDLETLSEGTDGGFYHDGVLVHVRLPGGAVLDDQVIEVSVRGRALWLEGASDVVVSGMVFRCYGGEEYSEGIMVRDGSHRVWITGNKFEHVMPGIWIKNDVDDLAVLENEFSDRGLAEFPWAAVKAQGGMESGAIAVDSAYDGQGIVFKGNTVHDSFDGLNICGDEPMGQPNNADVTGNTLYHLADDGIETDGDCSNIRIMLNRFEDALVGVSVAPAAVGPTYVLRNLMVDLKNVAPDSVWMTRALKFNVSDPRPSGDVFVYHNTASSFEEGQPAFGVTDESMWTEVTLANNIWLGAGSAFYYVNAGDDPFFQDHDLLQSIIGDFIYYQGDHYETVEDYYSDTGLCDGCLTGDPDFLDPEAGDYEILDSSPALDSARIIPGINDGYVGDGPDMGAHELGGIGPDADADGDADSDSDSDADGDPDGTGNGVSDMTPSDRSCACGAAGETGLRRNLLSLLISLLIGD